MKSCRQTTMACGSGKERGLGGAPSSFNAVQISAMYHAMVHEQERAGTAWTLEWMVLPQICVATAAALAAAARLTANICGLGRSERG